jgi:hypothetical protein
VGCSHFFQTARKHPRASPRATPPSPMLKPVSARSAKREWDLPRLACAGRQSDDLCGRGHRDERRFQSVEQRPLLDRAGQSWLSGLEAGTDSAPSRRNPPDRSDRFGRGDLCDSSFHGPRELDDEQQSDADQHRGPVWGSSRRKFFPALLPGDGTIGEAAHIWRADDKAKARKRRRPNRSGAGVIIRRPRTRLLTFGNLRISSWRR